VEHAIETTGRPVTAKFRRLDPDKLQAAKTEFLKMEKEGIIRRSNSCWASPLHMVLKADGTWRPCGDYRLLNLATTPDKYPVPNMQDLSARLHGCTVFSKLDLRKGYYQVPMRPSDILKTAVITPFGLWEFTRMPFGLRNAGQTFQRLMDRVGAGLDFVFIYLDDILVASQDEDTHYLHLRQILQRLKDNSLILNLEKCEFGKESVDFLGHKISALGAEPLLKHVKAVREFGKPTDTKSLQSFLGLVNFYRRFIRGAALILKPLTDALKGGKKVQLTWTSEMGRAFQAAKEAVCSAVCLSHPDPAAVLSLAVDASNTHVGAVLQQSSPAGGWRPLSFFSRKLSSAEARYSAFDRELLAAYLSIRHFRFLLEGRPFHVLTDHKPLTFALHKMTEPWSPRQQRHLSAIAEFTADIRHVAGRDNVVADALSRPPPLLQTPVAAVGPSEPPLDLLRLAEAQAADPTLMQAAKNSTLDLQAFQIQGQDLWCDVSTNTVRPLVPAANRESVFQQIHGIAHPGARATRRLITRRFVWPRMAADINQWCRECQHCARAKVVRHVHSGVQPIAVPSRRFAHVHVDIVGPFPTSAEGHTHILTMVDRATRWAEAVPMAGTATKTCAEAFFRGWISRFGVPEDLTSDRGAQFTSEVWTSLCHRLGVKQHLTTAYHPQANGLVERFHRQLKDALRARLAGVAWVEHLPWVMMGLRAAPKEDSGVSSAELVYGAPLTLPGEFLSAPEISTPELVQRIRSPLNSFTPLPTRPVPPAPDLPESLMKASHVYVLRGGIIPPLAPRYQGPYKVLERAPKTFKLAIGDQVETVSVDRLKPHLGLASPEPAEPPRRGRPPSTASGAGVATLRWADVVAGRGRPAAQPPVGPETRGGPVETAS
jgi:cleavage and polyadenylation specificity factor subunit 1